MAKSIFCALVAKGTVITVFVFVTVYLIGVLWQTRIRVAQWNTGLLKGINPTDVIANIPNNTDIIVMQEVWDVDVANRIISDTKKNYPYSHYEIGSNIVASCSENHTRYIELFEQCLSEHSIGNVDINNIAPCIPVLDEWLKNDALCAKCILSGISSGDVDTVRKCTVTKNGYQFMNNGSTGLLVLSKKPIEKAEFTPMKSFLLNRGILTFCVDRLRVVTSHFPFEYEGLTIPQSNQLEMAARVLFTAPDVVLCDMNSGPDYQPDAYNLFKNKPYHTAFKPRPTYCPTGTTNAACLAATDDKNVSIDHIFVRGISKEDPNTSNIVINKGKFKTFGESASDHVGLWVPISYNPGYKNIQC